MIISTTNSIENACIIKYHDIVVSNAVLGTNLFSDIGASFTDFFGGFSDTYQDKLQLLYKSVVKDIENKASHLGANGIVGFKIDFDEISGKGKSMFMVSAVGTAVSINILNNNLNNESETEFVTSTSLNDAVHRFKIIQKVKNNSFISDVDWSFILHNNIPEIAESLTDQYIKAKKKGEIDRTSHDVLLMKNFANFFSGLEINVAISVAYSYVEKNPSLFNQLIIDNNLFDAIYVSDYLKNGKFDIAIPLLTANKPIYTNEDIDSFREIISIIKDMPILGKFELSKGLLSKEKEKYICPNGHKNDSTVVFCENCGLNIKGLDSYQVDILDDFIIKADVLSTLLSK